MSSFIISHFSYCPLVWIFCSKKIYWKDKFWSWEIITDYSKRLRASLPLFIRGSTPNNILPTMYKFSSGRILYLTKWSFTWHYEWYFQVKRKYLRSPKLPHAPDRKSSFIEIRTRCYIVLVNSSNKCLLISVRQLL